MIDRYSLGFFTFSILFYFPKWCFSQNIQASDCLPKCDKENDCSGKCFLTPCDSNLYCEDAGKCYKFCFYSAMTDTSCQFHFQCAGGFCDLNRNVCLANLSFKISSDFNVQNRKYHRDVTFFSLIELPKKKTKTKCGIGRFEMDLSSTFSVRFYRLFMRVLRCGTANRLNSYQVIKKIADHSSGILKNILSNLVRKKVPIGYVLDVINSLRYLKVPMKSLFNLNQLSIKSIEDIYVLSNFTENLVTKYYRRDDAMMNALNMEIFLGKLREVTPKSYLDKILSRDSIFYNNLFEFDIEDILLSLEKNKPTFELVLNQNDSSPEAMSRVINRVAISDNRHVVEGTETDTSKPKENMEIKEILTESLKQSLSQGLTPNQTKELIVSRLEGVIKQIAESMIKEDASLESLVSFLKSVNFKKENTVRKLTKVARTILKEDGNISNHKKAIGKIKDIKVESKGIVREDSDEQSFWSVEPGEAFDDTSKENTVNNQSEEIIITKSNNIFTKKSYKRKKPLNNIDDDELGNNFKFRSLKTRRTESTNDPITEKEQLNPFNDNFDLQTLFKGNNKMDPGKTKNDTESREDLISFPGSEQSFFFNIDSEQKDVKKTTKNKKVENDTDTNQSTPSIQIVNTNLNETKKKENDITTETTTVIDDSTPSNINITTNPNAVEDLDFLTNIKAKNSTENIILNEKNENNSTNTTSEIIKIDENYINSLLNTTSLKNNDSSLIMNPGIIEGPIKIEFHNLSDINTANNTNFDVSRNIISYDHEESHNVYNSDKDYPEEFYENDYEKRNNHHKKYRSDQGNDDSMMYYEEEYYYEDDPQMIEEYTDDDYYFQDEIKPDKTHRTKSSSKRNMHKSLRSLKFPDKIHLKNSIIDEEEIPSLEELLVEQKDTKVEKKKYKIHNKISKKTSNTNKTVSNTKYCKVSFKKRIPHDLMHQHNVFEICLNHEWTEQFCPDRSLFFDSLQCCVAYDRFPCHDNCI